jgi:insertion element IS1 protein InsB
VCYEEIASPRCASLHVKKNGTTSHGKQNYQCIDCRRQFITDYTYRGCRPFIRALVVPMTMNSSGVRDIARVLSISPQTVMKTIRERPAEVCEPRVPPRIKDMEMDEFWSFIKDKSQQCWYGLNRATTRIAAYVLGRRTDESCRQLNGKLTACAVENFYTDDRHLTPRFYPPSGTRSASRKRRALSGTT